MSTRRYLVGGPSNSGKSTYVLSLAKRLAGGHGLRTKAIELDVWSGSYPAFAGEVSFAERPKKFGLDWDWRTPLNERLREFNDAQEDIVFGDLPGAKIDEAVHYMCREAKADGAIIVSRTLEGLMQWREAFESHGVPVAHECLSMQGRTPLCLRDLGRAVDPTHPDVAHFASLVSIDPDAIAQAALAADERFRQAFRMNYVRRSRTAQGRDENLDAPLKKKLMIGGDDLKGVALRNCLRLADDVMATPRPAAWTAEFLRERAERWFEIANEGIYDPEWYAEEFRMLTQDAALVERTRGVPVRINSRYRIWTPEHTLMKVPPLLLEEQMDIFYARLAELCARAEKHHPSWEYTLEALAYADIMMDGELRPWLDGCGRVATAVVMWIGRALGVPPPLFAASKEVHKMTMRDVDRHRLYLLECIRRADVECP